MKPYLKISWSVIIIADPYFLFYVCKFEIKNVIIRINYTSILNVVSFSIMDSLYIFNNFSASIDISKPNCSKL